jgi:hypothetical protein
MTRHDPQTHTHTHAHANGEEQKSTHEWWRAGNARQRVCLSVCVRLWSLPHKTNGQTGQTTYFLNEGRGAWKARRLTSTSTHSSSSHIPSQHRFHNMSLTRFVGFLLAIPFVGALRQYQTEFILSTRNQCILSEKLDPQHFRESSWVVKGFSLEAMDANDVSLVWHKVG